MNRAVIITIGIVTILLVLAIWVFLLLFGTPEKPQDIFSDLGIIKSTERDVSQEGIDTNLTDTALVRVGDTGLQQLTTEAIAGFGIATSGAKDIVRYVETGTGHIYEIDLVSGVKKQISRTTIPGIVSGVFSPQASVVALISHLESEAITIGEIPKNVDVDLQRTLLPLGARNVAFVDEGTVLYTRSTLQQTLGYSRSIADGVETKLFEIQVPNMTLVWGGHSADVYAYTKPTEHLEGYAYKIEGDTILPTTGKGVGFVPVIGDTTMIITAVDAEEKTYRSALLNQETDSPTAQPLVMLPEKCTFENKNIAWCGAGYEVPKNTYLEDWYKGVIHPQDALWRINTQSQTATLIANPEQDAGRPLDITAMSINTSKDVLLFINKTDGTLWMYTMTN